MFWKRFLKPDLRKKILFVILLVFFGLMSFRPPSITVKFFVGNPVDFLRVTHELAVQWNFLALGFDMFYWYMIACLVVYIFDKFREYEEKLRRPTKRKK